MPFLIAFIMALIIEPVIKWIKEKTKLTRKISTIIVLIIVFGVIIGGLIWGITAFIDEGANLLKMLNDCVETGYSYILGLLDKIKLDSFQISDEVINILKNALSEFLNRVARFSY